MVEIIMQTGSSLLNFVQTSNGFLVVHAVSITTTLRLTLRLILIFSATSRPWGLLARNVGSEK